jgi:signal transduction histidine kinase
LFRETVAYPGVSEAPSTWILTKRSWTVTICAKSSYSDHVEMTHQTHVGTLAKSPARRLGVLYVASFSTIAVISAINQALTLKELAWQSTATARAGAVATDRALGRPLSLAALALLSAGNAAERSELEASLRSAIQESRQSTPRTASLRDGLKSAGPRKRAMPPGDHLLQLVESHRLAATRSAEALLSIFDQSPAAPPRPAETTPHVRRIIEQEEAASKALAEAARGYAAQAAVHFDTLNKFELLLFGVMLLVLAIEGLFVVNPAVKRIQRFMDDLGRSHVELKDYAQKLERSNSELQDFASVASHDLQEPLRKVQAFSDRLRKRCAEALDDQGRDYLDRIQNAAARMQTLINDLLTYCRVATKAQPFVPTDLVSVTREVVSDLEARIEQVSGQVVLGELPTVDADPLQVRQLMQNLIGNSLKYSRPDVPPVVKVWSKHEPHDAGSAAGAPPRPFCQIVVEDNGIGFDQIYSERIFTIFQRLHGRNEYEGTGIGLAVCRRIVERHGGTITAQSTPGNGATFMVSLPIRQPTAGDN